MNVVDGQLGERRSPAVVDVTDDNDLVQRNLFELFQAQVPRFGNKAAVVGPDRTLSYGELAERAGNISRFLRANGLQDEQPVGVFMQRTADVVAVLLGILHAGGCYVPLDPAEPAERARFLAQRAGLSLVIGDVTKLGELRDAIVADGKRSATVDPALQTPLLVDVAAIVERGDDPESPDVSACAPGGHRLAYVMFTSGSTGIPKGVQVEHRNVINLLLAARDAIEFTADDRYLAVATLAFDISVAEVFLPLICGGSLVLGDRNMLLSRGGIAAAIVQHDVSVFQTGPSVWSLLLVAGEDFPRVRVAITTGEAAPPALARRIATVGDMVWNLYGPTETTVWCSGQRIDTPHGLDDSTDMAAPVGHMWPNMPGIIVGADGEIVPDGEIGDLWVGGLAVSRGYMNDAVLTNDRYVTRVGDPDRYYRTGDLVSRSARGVLQFHGRNDDQVQVHGIRIEPSEVETSVREDPFVEQAAATWFANESGGRSIVAGVVVKEGVRTTGPELHSRLAKRLTAALVPSRFVFYDTLPLTPNGKTDRLAIRSDAMRLLDEDAIDDVEETLSATERTLQGIWAATLRGVKVHRADNFFSVGGDSLAAVAMVLDAEDTFGISLSVQAVIEYPTLGEFAAHIDRLRAPGGDTAPDPRFTFQLVGQGSDRPVFFCAIELHLAGAGVWRVNGPLYSVNYWTLGRGFSKARTLERLAANHVAEIKEIQAVGPYRIAGFSFGGIVALEIAQQLRAAGDEIELLFLLDPTEPYRTVAAPDVERMDGVDRQREQIRNTRERLAPRLLRHARVLLRRRSAVIPYIREKAKEAPETLLGHTRFWPWIQFQLVDLHGRFPNALTARLLPEDRWIGFWYVAKRLAGRYVAKPFDGPTLAIFCEQNERLAAWTGLLADGVDVRTIRCLHGDLVVEPALTEWMNMLGSHLPLVGDRAADASD